MTDEFDSSEIIMFGETKKRRVLIDGDIFIHMACWQKPISKANQETLQTRINEEKEFGNFDKASELESSLETAKLTYQPTIEKAQERFSHFMKTSLEANYTDEFSMAIGNSSDNWRKLIHPEYKLQKARTGGKARAPYIQDLREWAVKKYKGHYCEGYEADDAIRCWATRLGIDNYVICSVDKDLNLIPGQHYDPKTEDSSKRFWYMEPNDSAMFFWEQMLMGDSIDNIPGIRGIGPKKTKTLLAPCKNEQDCKEVVVNQYALTYGDEGYKKLLFNGQLLHIWRTKGDIWSFDPEEYEEITGTKPITQ